MARINIDDEKQPLLGKEEDEECKEQLNGSINKDTRTEREPKSGTTKRAATFRELYSFSTWVDVLLILLAVVCAAAHGATWPLLFLVFGDMTNNFVSYGKNGTINTFNMTQAQIDEQFEDNATDTALKYIYIGAGCLVVTYVHTAFLTMAGERQTFKIRRTFFKSLLREDISWYDKQQSGELTTRLADDLERIREGIGDKLGLSIQFLSQFISGLVLGFVNGWKLALVLMSMTPFLAICAGVMGKLFTTFAAREQEKYAKAGGIAEEVLSCIRTVISFNGQPKEINRYSKALEESKAMGIKKSVVAGLSIGLTMLIMFCTYGLAFWYGSIQINDFYNSDGSDGINPGEVFTVFFGVLVGSFALGSASPHIQSLFTAKGAAGTIMDIIKDNPSINSSDQSGKKPDTVHGYIQLKDVNFSYATRKDIKVLKNCNIDITPGQTVALVGASGCGKSTIVNLIQRFYDPEEGKVILDGTDIKELNIHWLREKIGIVSQEPVLFGISIAKNIKLGNPGISMTEIIQAAKMANAHDFISRLPEGYDTLVGERGAQLSGGQKQRVAIARALVRDPKILLLDEATSALDAENEGIVQAALDKARAGRTTIVVAHRLSTIQKADTIYVMDSGVVVEKGKHSELMEKKGAYHSLVTLQTLVENDNLVTEDDELEAGDTSDLDSPEKVARGMSRQLSKPTTERQVSKNSIGDKPRTSSLKAKKEEEKENDKDVVRPGFFRMFKSNFKEWPFIVFGTIAATINGAIMPMFAVFFSEIINAFSLKGDDLLDKGFFWSMMFVAIGGASFFANLIQNAAFGISGEYLTKRLRLLTFTNMVRQDAEYFDDPKHATGALTTRLATDASNVRNATGIRLAVIVQSMTSMVSGMAIAFIFGWKLALAITGAIPLVILSGAINAKLMKGNQHRDSNLLEEAGKTASECVENIRTVQSLTREPYFYDQYCDQLIKPHKENIKQAHIFGLSNAFSQALFFFLYAGAFRFGAWLVVHDGMDPDLVFRVFFAIAFTAMSVGQASSFLPDYSKAQLSAGHIFTLLDIVPKIDIFSSLGIKSSISGEVELKDVHFSYPSRPDVEVLKGIDIKVRPGQTAALVGMSGCGKSTIVSLIQRYYDPAQGSIVIEGKNLREYNLKSIRSMISVVSQEPVLFDCTIRDNIVYGIESDIPMADVIAVARTANAHDFITSLPDGYNTLVGEKGTQLSGGQKQRVAIARALIRNPKILLLDEATSALDAESEKMVQQALDKAREGRTCIVIAHRLSTIQSADVIYTMDGGQVVESGSHKELLSRRGAYAALVQGQQFTREPAL